MSVIGAEMLSQFFAGASAGVVVLLATHWLDTLKLLGQLGPIDWKALLRDPSELYMGIMNHSWEHQGTSRSFICTFAHG